MPQVVRTATKGSNLFSKALVAFEDSRPTRRHTFGLAHLVEMPGAVRLEFTGWQPAPFNILQLSLTNTLPHSLPTGSFRFRPAHLAVRLYSQDRTLLAENLVALVEEKLPPLKPGEQRQLVIRLAPAHDAPPPCLLTVELRLDPSGNQAGMILATHAIPLSDTP